MEIAVNKKCMRCNSNKLITDMDSAEVFCAKCGFVIPEKFQRLDQEWRAFTKDEFNQRSRSGAPTSIAYYDMGLATIINAANRDSADRPLKRAMMYNMKRLRNLDRRSKFHTQTNINQSMGFTFLEGLIERLNLPDHISKRAAYIYRKALEKKLSKGRPILGIVTACVYSACRETDTNRDIRDFEQVSNVQRKEISRDYRILVNELNLKMPVVDPIQCVSRIANNLKINEMTKRCAIQILESVETSRIIAGKDPRGIAACALYMACLRCGENMTQKNIASASNVTEVTVRNRHKELAKTMKLLENLR